MLPPLTHLPIDRLTPYTTQHHQPDQRPLFPAIEREQSSWTRTCMSCGRRLYRRTLGWALYCPCGCWIWD